MVVVREVTRLPSFFLCLSCFVLSFISILFRHTGRAFINHPNVIKDNRLNKTRELKLN